MYLSYDSAVSAINDIAYELLETNVNRINQNTRDHLMGTEVVLNAAMPKEVGIPGAITAYQFPFDDNFAALEEKLWWVTGLWTSPNNYVYYGTADNRFLGVERIGGDEVNVKIKNKPDGTRDNYLSSKPGARITLLKSDEKYYPTERPWYKAAVAQGDTIWSPIYTSFSSGDLLITKSRPAFDAKGEIKGVLAADVSLAKLSDYLAKLKTSKNGIAMIVERDGSLIATSNQTEIIKKTADKKALRTNANNAESELIRLTFADMQLKIKQLMNNEIISSQFESPQFGLVYTAATGFRDDDGLDWLTIVAVPRADLLESVNKRLWRDILLALSLIALAVVLGYALLNWVIRDLRRINGAAQKLTFMQSAGDDFKVKRADEIGQLATSFQNMEASLLYDPLTKCYNRAVLTSRLGTRLADKNAINAPFAVMFMDLDGFKAINDVFGHDIGDLFLVTVADRLKKTVRVDDAVFRLGGDEFVIICESITTMADAGTVIEKLMNAIEKPIEFMSCKTMEDGRRTTVAENHVMYPGSSIGVALYPLHGLDMQSLLHHADQMMYAVKKQRKGLSVSKSRPDEY